MQLPDVEWRTGESLPFPFSSNLSDARIRCSTIYETVLVLTDTTRSSPMARQTPFH